MIFGWDFNHERNLDLFLKELTPLQKAKNSENGTQVRRRRVRHERNCSNLCFEKLRKLRLTFKLSFLKYAMYKYQESEIQNLTPTLFGLDIVHAVEETILNSLHFYIYNICYIMNNNRGRPRCHHGGGKSVTRWTSGTEKPSKPCLWLDQWLGHEGAL